MAPHRDKGITVIAEFEIVSSAGKETIRGFDNSWERQLQLSREGHCPVNCKFTGFVRKD